MTRRSGRRVAIVPHLDLVDTRIIAQAHQFVEGWRRDPKRRPFAEALHKAEGRLWGSLPDTDLHRKVFRQVASAIRVGHGHIETNPRPLVDIVRRALRHGPTPR